WQEFLAQDTLEQHSCDHVAVPFLERDPVCRILLHIPGQLIPYLLLHVAAECQTNCDSEAAILRGESGADVNVSNFVEGRSQTLRRTVPVLTSEVPLFN